MSTNRFRSYLRCKVPKDKLPSWIYGYTIPSNGIYISFKEFDFNIIPESLRMYYLTTSFLNNAELEKWLRWITKVLNNENMINTEYTTDAVRIRIATGMLNKLTIPERHKQLIHARLLECYHIRKQACINYKITHVLKVPF